MQTKIGCTNKEKKGGTEDEGNRVPIRDDYTTKEGREVGEVTLVGSDLGRHPIGLSLVEGSVDDRSILERNLERKSSFSD